MYIYIYIYYIKVLLNKSPAHTRRWSRRCSDRLGPLGTVREPSKFQDPGVKDWILVKRCYLSYHSRDLK